jgi:hypothetical protein
MDAKKSKYLDAVFNYTANDLSKDKGSVLLLIQNVANIDLTDAFIVWEYLLIKYDRALDNSDYTDVLILDPFHFFVQKNEIRAYKTIIETPLLMRVLYGYTPSPCDGDCLNLLIYCLMSGKLQKSEEIFKLLIKNGLSKNSYGSNMKIIIEKLFLEILKKMGGGTKKAELNKKLATLLVSYVKKIVGPERALLEQRIKEVQ